MPYKDYEKQKENARQNYYLNREKKKKQAKDYYYNHYEKRKKQKELWASKNIEKLKVYRKIYAAKYRQRKKLEEIAHWKVSNAIRYGKMEKPETCSKCKRKTLLHAHHNDYTKPLEVEWLCHACHFIKHMRKGGEINVTNINKSLE